MVIEGFCVMASTKAVAYLENYMQSSYAILAFIGSLNIMCLFIDYLMILENRKLKSKRFIK